MANNRKRYEALEPRYKVFWQGRTCYYCGDRSDTEDHVPPLSVAYALGAEELEKRGAKFLKVSACRECNALLGNQMILSLEDRGRYVYQAIQNRYQRFLESRRWEYREDLEDLGPNLRDYIEKHSNVQTWVERRLIFLENTFQV